MKKRAQYPNAQTYTIIFRGCAISSHPKLAVSEATRIYYSMLNSDRLKPNTIHMNAVLQVCAKTEDLDTLFSVAQSANNGLRAPNTLTYTTIINALRYTADKRQHGIVSELDIAELEKAKAKAIQQAKAIWEEVMSKWKDGSIIMDEELVCAMGRILLIGDYYDANAVEALISQTMARRPPKRFPPEPENSGERYSKTENYNEITPDRHPTSDNPKPQASGAPAISYATPGMNSLSLVLSALEKTGKTTKVEQYWNSFTGHHGVIPDANNWNQLFATLRRGKNSGKTAYYLQAMPTNLMTPKTFRIAMSTCLRDNLNPLAFKHATDVLCTMTARLNIPDLLVMRTYLRVAYANKRHLMQASKDNYEAAMLSWGEQLAAALDHLWKPYMIATREYGDDTPESNDKSELVALARKMIAVSDRIISGKMIPPEAGEQIKLRRNGLNRVVVQHFEQMVAINPNFQLEKDPDDDEDENDFDGLGAEFRPKKIIKDRRPRANGR